MDNQLLGMIPPPNLYHYPTIQLRYDMTVKDVLDFLNEEVRKNSNVLTYSLDIGEYSCEFSGKEKKTKEVLEKELLDYQSRLEKHHLELKLYIRDLK